MIPVLVKGSIILFLSIVGLIGNLFVTVVVGAKRKLHTMHFFLLANLSLSDFFLQVIATINAISFINEQWIFGQAWCEGTFYLLRCFLVTTILLLCAVTWECHTAVVTPYQFSSEITVKKVAAIVILWVASFLLAVLSIIMAGSSVDYNVKTHRCQQDFKSNKNSVVFFITMILVFTIPFGLIGKQQYQIHQLQVAKEHKSRIAQQQRNVNANRPEAQQQIRIMKNVKESKDAIIIVVAFLVSYLPLSITTGLISKLPESDTMYKAWFSAVVLAQAGSTWNPFLYGFRKRLFRRQCLQFVCRIVSSQVNPQ